MFNNYIWELYKQVEGTQIINMFRKNLTGKLQKAYADEIKRLHIRYAIEDVVADNYEQLLELSKVIKARTKVVFLPGAVRGTASTKEIFRAIDSVMHDAIQRWVEEDGREQDVLAGFIDSLSYTSTNWAILYPGVFTPYYFSKNYNVLTTIADTFGIELPALPKKSDYFGRVRHYGELCKAFYRFRQKNALGFYDFCAFLYDFAPQYWRKG